MSKQLVYSIPSVGGLVIIMIIMMIDFNSRIIKDFVLVPQESIKKSSSKIETSFLSEKDVADLIALYDKYKLDSMEPVVSDDNNLTLDQINSQAGYIKTLHTSNEIISLKAVITENDRKYALIQVHKKSDNKKEIIYLEEGVAFLDFKCIKILPLVVELVNKNSETDTKIFLNMYKKDAVHDVKVN